MLPVVVFSALYLAGLSQAHLVAWHKAMYCLNGTSGKDDQNTADAVSPLWDLPLSQWWFHAVNGCDKFPPSPGDFIELPAGGTFTVEIAASRAVTTLSYNGLFTSPWGDGKQHPEDYSMTNLGDQTTTSHCIPSPNMHTTNESYAAGTVFAISYNSDLSQVTQENLVVFTALYHTPWKRIATYQVPSKMPPCPPGGCICAWGWVPNGCGEPNMYMTGYRCNVTGSTSTIPVAAGKPPVWCEGTPETCVKGAKQMVYWNQNDGNNTVVTGYQADGLQKSPGYNMKMGFANGPQNDIFETSNNDAPQCSRKMHRRRSSKMGLIH